MIIVYLFNFLSFAVLSLHIKKFLHIYQLKDYNNIRYFKFFHFKWLVFLATSIVLFSTIFIQRQIIKITIYTICLLASFLFIQKLIKSNKTPLVRTPRIRHLFIFSFAVLFATCLIPFSYIFLNLVLLALPIISNALNFYDRKKNKQYILKAQTTLKSSNAKVIAITGSNGKTSVKNILLKMLSSKYKTQATPSSFNTPLGISKFINEKLNFDTEFLILEYGARHKNDVLDLCNLFGADFGIITCINPQHLESFKTIENVKIAKGELSKFLDKKVCIFNIDNSLTHELYIEKSGLKNSISIANKSADLTAKNIKIVNYKTEFDLCINSKRFHVSTNLLGRHNVTNILLASALALELNIDISIITNVIRLLEPTPHRLELIRKHINILDDSYNCSIESAKEAIWTLSQFSGKKMIVTPGIIEGGKEQYNINFKLGKMCSCSDYCIIIGKENKKAILDGLKSLDYKEKNIFMCANLEQAKSYFTLLNENDTLLLLNDLPDDYN